MLYLMFATWILQRKANDEVPSWLISIKFPINNRKRVYCMPIEQFYLAERQRKCAMDK
jgi:hypothetical protein